MAMRIHHLGVRARGAALASAEARTRYLARLAGQLCAADWQLLSYCVAPEGVSLGLLGGAAPLQAVVYPLHGEIGDRLEHVVGVVPSFAAHMICYHHNTPVRARRAGTAWDCAWTSYRAYVRLGPRPPWLAIDRGLSLCGVNDTPAGRRRLDETTHRRSLIGSGHWLSPEHVGAIRRAVYALSPRADGGPGVIAPAPGDTRPESRPAALAALAVPTTIARERVDRLPRPQVQLSPGIVARLHRHSGVGGVP